MQRNVRELFEVLRGKEEGFVKIDAGGSLEEVQGRVKEVVKGCLEREVGEVGVVEDW